MAWTVPVSIKPFLNLDLIGRLFTGEYEAPGTGMWMGLAYSSGANTTEPEINQGGYKRNRYQPWAPGYTHPTWPVYSSNWTVGTVNMAFLCVSNDPENDEFSDVTLLATWELPEIPVVIGDPISLPAGTPFDWDFWLYGGHNPFDDRAFLVSMFRALDGSLTLPDIMFLRMTTIPNESWGGYTPPQFLYFEFSGNGYAKQGFLRSACTYQVASGVLRISSPVWDYDATGPWVDYAGIPSCPISLMMADTSGLPTDWKHILFGWESGWLTHYQQTPGAPGRAVGDGDTLTFGVNLLVGPYNGAYSQYDTRVGLVLDPEEWRFANLSYNRRGNLRRPDVVEVDCVVVDQPAEGPVGSVLHSTLYALDDPNSPNGVTWCSVETVGNYVITFRMNLYGPSLRSSRMSLRAWAIRNPVYYDQWEEVAVWIHNNSQTTVWDVIAAGMTKELEGFGTGGATASGEGDAEALGVKVTVAFKWSNPAQVKVPQVTGDRYEALELEFIGRRPIPVYPWYFEREHYNRVTSALLGNPFLMSNMDVASEVMEKIQPSVFGSTDMRWLKTRRRYFRHVRVRYLNTDTDLYVTFTLSVWVQYMHDLGGGERVQVGTSEFIFLSSVVTPQTQITAILDWPDADAVGLNLGNLPSPFGDGSVVGWMWQLQEADTDGGPCRTNSNYNRVPGSLFARTTLNKVAPYAFTVELPVEEEGKLWARVLDRAAFGGPLNPFPCRPMPAPLSITMWKTDASGRPTGHFFSSGGVMSSVFILSENFVNTSRLESGGEDSGPVFVVPWLGDFPGQAEQGEEFERDGSDEWNVKHHGDELVECLGKFNQHTFNLTLNRMHVSRTSAGTPSVEEWVEDEIVVWSHGFQAHRQRLRWWKPRFTIVPSITTLQLYVENVATTYPDFLTVSVPSGCAEPVPYSVYLLFSDDRVIQPLAGDMHQGDTSLETSLRIAGFFPAGSPPVEVTLKVTNVVGPGGPVAAGEGSWVTESPVLTIIPVPA